MFVRLTRRKRARAGWFVALLYLLCVIAPGTALALGNPAPCLPAEMAPVVHEHVHSAGAAHAHGGIHADHEADASHAGHSDDGKTAPGPCCAMLCVSAIPASLPAVAKPAQPITACVFAIYQRLPGKAPPLLYRPPIA